MPRLWIKEKPKQELWKQFHLKDKLGFLALYSAVTFLQSCEKGNKMSHLWEECLCELLHRGRNSTDKTELALKGSQTTAANFLNVCLVFFFPRCEAIWMTSLKMKGMKINVAQYKPVAISSRWMQGFRGVWYTCSYDAQHLQQAQIWLPSWLFNKQC